MIRESKMFILSVVPRASSVPGGPAFKACVSTSAFKSVLLLQKDAVPTFNFTYTSPLILFRVHNRGIHFRHNPTYWRNSWGEGIRRFWLVPDVPKLTYMTLEDWESKNWLRYIVWLFREGDNFHNVNILYKWDCRTTSCWNRLHNKN